MKKTKVLLFGLILTSAQFAVFAQDEIIGDVAINTEQTTQITQEVDEALEAASVTPATSQTEEIAQIANQVITQDELEKWSYVGKYFTSNINTSKIHQKIGAFLNKYSSYISACVPIFGFLISCGIVCNVKSNKPPYKTLDYTYPKTCFVAGFVIAPLIAFLITNKTLQFIGKKLDNKEDRCCQLLTDFVKNWDQNKEQTPAVLHPLFQNLREDLVQNGRFTKINNKFAQEIVQAMITGSLIVNLIN